MTTTSTTKWLVATDRAMLSPSSPPRRTKRLKRVPTFGGDKNYLIGIGFGLFALAIFGAIYLVSNEVVAIFYGSMLLMLCEGTL